MRSLIIIEVEHGEDTDQFDTLATLACSLPDSAEGLDNLTVMDYALRVDVQPFMTAVSINSIIDRGTGQSQ